jgi:hypothetical protein
MCIWYVAQGVAAHVTHARQYMSGPFLGALLLAVLLVIPNRLAPHMPDVLTGPRNARTTTHLQLSFFVCTT